MDTEDDKESSTNVAKCEGTWRTSEASWLDKEGAEDEEVLVVSVLRAEVGKPPECLIDKEEFLA
jgi:hypothetical protein